MTLDGVALFVGYVVLGLVALWSVASLLASVGTWFFRRWLTRLLKGADMRRGR